MGGAVRRGVGAVVVRDGFPVDHGQGGAEVEKGGPKLEVWELVEGRVGAELESPEMRAVLQSTTTTERGPGRSVGPGR